VGTRRYVATSEEIAKGNAEWEMAIERFVRTLFLPRCMTYCARGQKFDRCRVRRDCYISLLRHCEDAC